MNLQHQIPDQKKDPSPKDQTSAQDSHLIDPSLRQFAEMLPFHQDPTSVEVLDLVSTVVDPEPPNQILNPLSPDDSNSPRSTILPRSRTIKKMSVLKKRDYVALYLKEHGLENQDFSSGSPEPRKQIKTVITPAVDDVTSEQMFPASTLEDPDVKRQEAQVQTLSPNDANSQLEKSQERPSTSYEESKMEQSPLPIQPTREEMTTILNADSRPERPLFESQIQDQDEEQQQLRRTPSSSVLMTRRSEVEQQQHQRLGMSKEPLLEQDLVPEQIPDERNIDDYGAGTDTQAKNEAEAATVLQTANALLLQDVDQATTLNPISSCQDTVLLQQQRHEGDSVHNQNLSTMIIDHHTDVDRLPTLLSRLQEEEEQEEGEEETIRDHEKHQEQDHHTFIDEEEKEKSATVEERGGAAAVPARHDDFQSVVRATATSAMDEEVEIAEFYPQNQEGDEHDSGGHRNLLMMETGAAMNERPEITAAATAAAEYHPQNEEVAEQEDDPNKRQEEDPVSGVPVASPSDSQSRVRARPPTTSIEMDEEPETAPQKLERDDKKDENSGHEEHLFFDDDEEEAGIIQDDDDGDEALLTIPLARGKEFWQNPLLYWDGNPDYREQDLLTDVGAYKDFISKKQINTVEGDVGDVSTDQQTPSYWQPFDPSTLKKPSVEQLGGFFGQLNSLTPHFKWVNLAKYILCYIDQQGPACKATLDILVEQSAHKIDVAEYIKWIRSQGQQQQARTFHISDIRHSQWDQVINHSRYALLRYSIAKMELSKILVKMFCKVLTKVSFSESVIITPEKLTMERIQYQNLSSSQRSDPVTYPRPYCPSMSAKKSHSRQSISSIDVEEVKNHHHHNRTYLTQQTQLNTQLSKLVNNNNNINGNKHKTFKELLDEANKLADQFYKKGSTTSFSEPASSQQKQHQQSAMDKDGRKRGQWYNKHKLTSSDEITTSIHGLQTCKMLEDLHSDASHVTELEAAEYMFLPIRESTIPQANCAMSPSFHYYKKLAADDLQEWDDTAPFPSQWTFQSLVSSREARRVSKNDGDNVRSQNEMQAKTKAPEAMRSTQFEVEPRRFNESPSQVENLVNSRSQSQSQKQKQKQQPSHSTLPSPPQEVLKKIVDKPHEGLNWKGFLAHADSWKTGLIMTRVETSVWPRVDLANLPAADHREKIFVKLSNHTLTGLHLKRDYPLAQKKWILSDFIDHRAATNKHPGISTQQQETASSVNLVSSLYTLFSQDPTEASLLMCSFFENQGTLAFEPVLVTSDLDDLTSMLVTTSFQGFTGDRVLLTLYMFASLMMGNANSALQEVQRQTFYEVRQNKPGAREALKISRPDGFYRGVKL